MSAKIFRLNKGHISVNHKKMNLYYSKQQESYPENKNSKRIADIIKQLYYITFLTFVNEIKILSVRLNKRQITNHKKPKIHNQKTKNPIDYIFESIGFFYFYR